MPVTIETRGPVVLITLDRPDKCNAIDPPMAASLEAAIDRLEADTALRVGVLRAVQAPGRRPVFCAGHDLEHFLRHFGTPEEHAVSTVRGGFAGFVRRRRSKPVIAAVDGLATAGGFEIVLACDLLIATPQAAFALPETRWNLTASGGGVFMAPRALGRMVAADMLLTGAEIGGERAYALGLASRLVPAERLIDEAMQAAHAICANAPLALALTREAIERCETADRETAWSIALEGEARLRGTADLREGLASFVERRPPCWTGR